VKLDDKLLDDKLLGDKKNTPHAGQPSLGLNTNLACEDPIFSTSLRIRLRTIIIGRSLIQAGF